MAPRFLDKLAPRRKTSRVQPRFSLPTTPGSTNVAHTLESLPVAPLSRATDSRDNSAPTVPILPCSTSQLPKSPSACPTFRDRDFEGDSTDEISGQPDTSLAKDRKRRIMSSLGGAVKRMMTNLCRLKSTHHSPIVKVPIGNPFIIPTHSDTVTFEPIVEVSVEQNEEQSVEFFSLRLDALFEEQLAKCVSLGKLEVGEELMVAAHNLLGAVRRMHGISLSNEVTSIFGNMHENLSPPQRRFSTIVYDDSEGGETLSRFTAISTNSTEDPNDADGPDSTNSPHGEEEAKSPALAKVGSSTLLERDTDVIFDGRENVSPLQNECSTNRLECLAVENTSFESLHFNTLFESNRISRGSPRSTHQSSSLEDTASQLALSTSSSFKPAQSRSGTSVGERRRSPRMEQLIALFEGSSLTLTQH